MTLFFTPFTFSFHIDMGSRHYIWTERLAKSFKHLPVPVSTKSALHVVLHHRLSGAFSIQFYEKVSVAAGSDLQSRAQAIAVKKELY